MAKITTMLISKKCNGYCHKICHAQGVIYFIKIIINDAKFKAICHSDPPRRRRISMIVFII